MYLEKNLYILKHTNPALAERIEKVSISNTIEVMPTHCEKSYTCRASKANNGYRVLVHSLVNPIEEAIEQVNELEGLDKSYFTCIFGFGFGYHVKEILKQKVDRGCVLVIEPRIDILKAALTYIDFTDILSDGRLSIIDTQGNLREDLYAFLKDRIEFQRNVVFFQLPVYDYLVESGIQPLRHLYAEVVKYIFIMMGNSVSDTLLGVANTFNNLEYIFSSHDITSLKEKYSGVPAVVVSAGPSLDKNFRLLKDIKGKALIIAAETIQGKLLQNGIVPDIISVLERGIYVYNTFFKDKELNPDIVLCGQSLIHSDIFKDYPGKKVVCLKKSTFFEEWLSSVVDGVNTFEVGQSVANMNFSLARELGCNPIILIGQDLSYSIEGKTHAGGTVYQNDTINESKSKGLETFKIKGNYIDYVYTNIFWHQFLKWFELEIPKTDAEVINATEGGAYIEGTKLMTFKEAIEKYCAGRNCIVDLLNDLTNVSLVERENRVKKFVDAIETEFAKFDDARALLEKGVEKCKRILEKRVNTLEDAVNDFRIINECRHNLLSASRLFVFIIQAPRTVQFMKDADFIELKDFEQLEKWTEVQNQYFVDMLRILDLTVKVFTFGLEKAKTLIDGQDIDSLDFEKLLAEIGE